MDTKLYHCARCGEHKTLKNFYVHKSGRRIGKKANGQCRPCQTAYSREYHAKNPERTKTYQQKNHLARWLRKWYGISIDEYQALLIGCNNRCQICGEPPKQNERLFVDHCHSTNKVRGLLCRICNFGIGHFKDNPELMERAVAYLK